MKNIKTKFDKHDIPDLPKVLFEGRVVTIIGEDEAGRAVDFLLKQPILGLDTETKPRFKPGSGMNKVALLQVSTPDVCFLFRLNRIGMPPCIIRLLEDTTVTKIGLSWHDDLAQLRRRTDFQPGTFVELQELVKMIGIKDLSLQKIYANLFGQKISKSQRLTNWEAEALTPGQQLYAATDAWACIQIYQEVLRLHETRDFTLEVIPEPEPPQPKPKTEKEEPMERPGKKESKAAESATDTPDKPKKKRRYYKPSPKKKAGDKKKKPEGTKTSVRRKRNTIPDSNNS